MFEFQVERGQRGSAQRVPKLVTTDGRDMVHFAAADAYSLDTAE
jgi:hypothetical protein